MSHFVPLNDTAMVLVERDFVSHGEKENLPFDIDPSQHVRWKPTRDEEPATGEEPMLFFLSGTHCVLGEVRTMPGPNDSVELTQTAPFVKHIFDDTLRRKLPSLHSKKVPLLHYGVEVSVDEIAIPSPGEGPGELRRAATCFLQKLDPRWISTSEVFRRYDPFTEDIGWFTWDSAREGRCKCNLVCLLFHTDSDLGLNVRAGNAIASIASKEKIVSFPNKGCNAVPGIVPELDGDLREISVNDGSFLVVNTDAAMLHFSTASLHGILGVMVMTVCFCPMRGFGLPLERQMFPDLSYLRQKSDLSRADTQDIPALPEEFRASLNVNHDDEDETGEAVSPSSVTFQGLRTKVASGLKHRTKFEVGSYVEMCLMCTDGKSFPAAIGIIAHLPETTPIKKVIIRGKECQNERFVGVCFRQLVDAKYKDVKYEIGLKDRTDYEVKTIGDFVVGEEYLWDLCFLNPLDYLPKERDDVRAVMESAKSQFLERWRSTNEESYAAEYIKPPNWRQWYMQDRSIVPFEI